MDLKTTIFYWVIITAVILLFLGVVFGLIFSLLKSFYKAVTEKQDSSSHPVSSGSSEMIQPASETGVLSRDYSFTGLMKFLFIASELVLVLGIFGMPFSDQFQTVSVVALGVGSLSGVYTMFHLLRSKDSHSTQAAIILGVVFLAQSYIWLVVSFLTGGW